MWKKWILLIFSGFLFISDPVSGLGQERHFYDNFDEGVEDRWQLEPGWRVHQDGDNHVLFGTGHQWAMLQFGHDWSNYFFHHRFRLLRGRIHINFRMGDQGRYFIGVGEEELYLNKEAPPGQFSTLEATDAWIELNAWHDIEIVGNGGHLQVFLDGMLKIDFIDPDYLKQGSIAFETLDDSYAYIDDVEIAFRVEDEIPQALGKETDREEFRPRKEDEILMEVPNRTADVDLNIPQTGMVNKNAIAVVIGNRNYQKTKDVTFAINDARTMKDYLTNTLGYKEGNIFFVENATKGDFELYFGVWGNYKGKLFNTIKKNKSDVFIFYSGHGAPSLKNKKGYFVPVDCDPQYIELGGYALETFYENILKIPAKFTTVVLDACFSGATIFENISPIVIQVSNPLMTSSNCVVLSSSSGNQVSSWYNEKNHSMFTYFLLKAIHNKNADFNKDDQLTFAEIYKYISDESEGVPYYARRIHGVEQNPTIQGKNKDSVFVRY